MIKCVNGCGPMTETPYEGVNVDVCKTCSGVWLDFAEMTSIVETKEKSWPEETIRKVLAQTGKAGIPLAEKERKIQCPKCEKNLSPTNYQNNSGIIVNACENSHGMWLDAGEISKIQIFMEKWDNASEKDGPKYKKILDDVEKRFEKKEQDRVGEGPSSFRMINVFIAFISSSFD